MSGSGGGGYGGGFERAGASCEDLVINTQVGSPQAAVIAAISVNDILDVQLQQQGNVSLVVLLFRGQLAGGIASPEIQRLRECLQGGTAYTARVTSISGAHVGVRIAAVGAAGT